MSEQDLPIATPVEYTTPIETQADPVVLPIIQDVVIADPPSIEAELAAPEATYPPVVDPVVITPEEIQPTAESAPTELAIAPESVVLEEVAQALPEAEATPVTEFQGILPIPESTPSEPILVESPAPAPDLALLELNEARQIAGLEPLTQLDTEAPVITNVASDPSLLQAAVAQTPEDLKKFMIDNIKRSALTWFNSCVDKASSDHEAKKASGELAQDLPVTRDEVVDTILLSIMEHHIVATRQARALMMAMELEETIVGVSPDVATTEGALDTPLM